MRARSPPAGPALGRAAAPRPRAGAGAARARTAASCGRSPPRSGALPAASVAVEQQRAGLDVGAEAGLVAAGGGLGQRQRARRRRRAARRRPRSRRRRRRGPTRNRSSAPTASIASRTTSPARVAADREVGGGAPPHGRARQLRPQLLERRPARPRRRPARAEIAGPRRHLPEAELPAREQRRAVGRRQDRSRPAARGRVTT